MNFKGIWIDERKKRNFSIVSHAHMDHLGPHDILYGTKVTLDLAETRLKKKFKGIAIPYYNTQNINRLEITLYPAGHVLGASQLFITDGYKSYLYSGDFDLNNGFTRMGAVVPEAQVLIMDATYGSPDFIFPRREEVASHIIEWVLRQWRLGWRPVFFVYSIGKAQELIKILEELGENLIGVDIPVKRATEVYTKNGVFFKAELTLNRDARLFVFSSGRRGKVKELPADIKTAVCTGWAVKYHFTTDMAFPLSDHADFVDLLAYVEEVNPSEVYVLRDRFGFSERLREMGLKARSI